MLEKLIEFLDKRMESGAKGYDVIVYQGGKEVFRHYNGYADYEKKTPIYGDELYYLYSCSKPITCCAALQLLERGLYSLDDKLSDYMPEFAEMQIASGEELKAAKNPILIRHLFEMSAGFDYDEKCAPFKDCIEKTDGRAPTREIIRRLAERPLGFEPGARWRYSLCHDALAAFVEVVSGERFGDYVQKNIFAPLGMDNATFRLTSALKEKIAPLYIYDAQKKAPLLEKRGNGLILGTDYESGGAGCICNVRDYILFLEGIRTYKLLKKETVDLWRTDRLSPLGIDDAGYWKKATHGYGLGVRCSKGVEGYGDFGWDGAAGAFMAIDLENEITVFYAQHLLADPNNPNRHMVYDFVRDELAKKP